MASEYLKWKYRDVQPDAPAEQTKKQRRQNWWHYHKWYVVLGAAAVLMAGNLVWHTATQVRPDYQIAYVGGVPLPDTETAAWEDRLSTLGTDCNGDGKVIIKINQYVTPQNTDDALYAYASNVKLMADLDSCESYFFLLEDPDQFQREYHTLRRLDGTLPEEEEDSAEGTYLAWADCPVLAALELGEYSYGLMDSAMTGSNQELLSPLCLARRGFWTEKASAYTEGCDELWNKLTEGATP